VEVGLTQLKKREDIRQDLLENRQKKRGNWRSGSCRQDRGEVLISRGGGGGEHNKMTPFARKEGKLSDSEVVRRVLILKKGEKVTIKQMVVLGLGGKKRSPTKSYPAKSGGLPKKKRTKKETKKKG